MDNDAIMEKKEQILDAIIRLAGNSSNEINSTKFVESAFRHFGKDSSHGILSLFGTQLCHCKNVSAISCKLPCKNKKTNLILKFSTDFFSLEYLQQNYVSKQQVISCNLVLSATQDQCNNFQLPWVFLELFNEVCYASLAELIQEFKFKYQIILKQTFFGTFE